MDDKQRKALYSSMGIGLVLVLMPILKYGFSGQVAMMLIGGVLLGIVIIVPLIYLEKKGYLDRFKK